MIRLYLKEWRNAKGISLLQLAALAQMPTEMIARLEYNDMTWTSKDLEAFAKAMRMDPADLLKPPPK